MKPYLTLFIQAKVTDLAYECIFFGAANFFVFVHGVTRDGTACASAY
jgi:hypothetical protein